jgi:hypothetical protein
LSGYSTLKLLVAHCIPTEPRSFSKLENESRSAIPYKNFAEE